MSRAGDADGGELAVGVMDETVSMPKLCTYGRRVSIVKQVKNMIPSRNFLVRWRASNNSYMIESDISVSLISLGESLRQKATKKT